MAVRVSWRKLLDSLAGVAYLVEADGEILAVGSTHWQRFAKANGGAGIADEATVVGRNLFDFIAGGDVVEGYRRLIDRLKADPTRAIHLPFRCDAPNIRREAQMLVSAVPNGGGRAFLFQCLPLREVKRPPVDLLDHTSAVRLPGPTARRSTVTICSYCLNVRPHDRSGFRQSLWIEQEVFQRFSKGQRVTVHHGVCPHCQAAVTDAKAA